MRKIIALLLVLIANHSFGQTTFPWSGTYGGSGTNRTYTTTVSGVTMSATIVNSENVWQDLSPKWFPTGSTNPGGGCSGIGAANQGMLLSTDWTTNTTKTITTVITFSTPVQGPVNFSLYDINDDGFGSWEDRIIITGTNSVASPVNVFKVGTACVQTGGSVTGNGTNTLTFNSGISTACTCWGNNEVNVGTSSDCISTVTIQYRSNTSPTNYNNPKQYIVISNIEATIPTAVSAPSSITGTTSICGSGSTTLTAVGGGANTNWYTGSCGGTLVGTGASISVSPGSTTTYYAANSGGCGFLSSCASATVTVNPQPTAVPGPSLALNCTTQSGSISVSTNAGSPGYLWTGPSIVSGNNTANPIVDAAGTYNVTVTNTATGCTNTTSVNVTMNNTPPTAVPGSPLALTCTVLSGNISASSNAGGATFLWSGPSIVSGGNTATPTVDAPGTYNVTVTNPANGCTNTTSVNVTLNNTQPTAVPGSPLALNCTTLSGTISASSNAGGATYLWSGPSILSGGNTSTPTVDAPGTYNVTVTNPANGCTNTTSVNVTLNNTIPTAVAGPPLSLNCTTLSGIISASSNAPGATFVWSGTGIVSGGNTSSPTVSAGGTFNVIVTNPANGCTNTTSVNVTMNNTPPTAVPGSPLALSCTVLSGTISASSNVGGATYLWSGPSIVSGGNTSTPTVDAPGTYNVTITNPANGCTNTTSVNVTLNNTQPTAVPGSPLALNCTTSSGTISASSNVGGATYLWSGPSIVSGGNTSTPTVDAPGTYNVTITNPANGCTNTTSVNVTLNNTIPTAVPGSTLALNCTTLSGTISASSNAGGATFLWSGPSIVSGGNTSTPTVDAAGTYNVTVTNPANGCTNTTSVNVTMNNTLPNISMGADQELNCSVSSVTISGSSSTSGVTFAWTDSGSNPAGTTPTSTSTVVMVAGTYTLTVTNPSNGCTITGTVNVTSSGALPDLTMGADQELNCQVSSVTIDGSTSIVNPLYSWTDASSNPAGTTPNSSSTSVSSPGVYTLTVTNPLNGCSISGTVVVSSNPEPISIAGTNDTITCIISSVILDGTGSSVGANFTYLWTGPSITSGSTTLNPTVDEPGTYTLTVTDSNTGCTSATTVVIVADTVSPVIVANANSTIDCTNSQINLDASSSTGNNLDFAWNGPGIISGGNTSSPLINQAGNYDLILTNTENGCSDNFTVTVIVDTIAPIISAGNDTSFTCGGVNVVLDATTVNGATYIWTGTGIVSGGNTSSVTINQSGSYSVTVTGANGCSATDDVNVTFGSGPNASFTLTPNNGQVPILVSTDNNSTGNGLSYSWNFDNGSTSTAMDTSTTYTMGGTYDVELIVVDSLGCTDTAIVQITLDNSDLEIPNGFTPNGDGINDVFQIVGLEQYELNKITIFNRWGELVFTAEPYLNDWDGRCNNPTLVLSGDKVVDGTYFFVLDLGNDTPAINGYVEMKSR